MRVLPYGDAALLADLGPGPAGGADVLAAAAAVEAAGWAGVVDVVTGARSVLVVLAPGAPGTPGADLAATARRLAAVDPGAAPAPAPRDHEIPVTYDGPDLGAVADLTGLAPEQVVAAHTGTPWRVAFGGFAPGFGYLVGGDPRLRVPRRDSPRTSVPAGAVGLAGEFSGVYPRASPGGWQLIGRTEVALWDLDRDPPALLRPGDAVRFTRAPSRGGHIRHGPDRPPGVGSARPGSGRTLEVLATGPVALVQDLGRPGLAAVGVGRSGAADRAALRLANRLVANPEGAAGIEAVLGGLAVRAGTALTAALAGAHAPADVDGRPVGHHAVLRLRAGQVLRLSQPAHGLRTYLAVRGGIAVAPVLGSRSTDVLAGLGPAPLRAGAVLPVGPEPEAFPLLDVAPVPPPPGGVVALRAVRGPHAGFLADAAALAGTAWTASARSDRVGMRLDGPPLLRSRGEVPTAGVVRGAVQVPPDGQPVLFLADHPVTGGYPVVAVLLDADADRAAQVRPGQGVRLRLVPAPW